MRSPEQMKMLVRQEAARRRNRRRAIGAGAAAVVVLLLGAAVVRPSSGPPMEVSTAADDASVTTPGTHAPSVDVPTTAPRDPALPGAEEGGAEVPDPTGTSRPTGPTPSTTRLAPVTLVPSAGDGPGPVSTEPPGPSTTAPPSTATTSTTAGVRVCSDDDIVETALEMVAVPAFDLPVGAIAEFGYSTVTRPDIPACWTTDSLRVVTITDQHGRVVFRSASDGGPTRLVEPGRWVSFQASATWDPSCPAHTDPPGVTTTCLPVGPGTYSVAVYDQGATLGPVTVTIVHGAP
jgi:hypothetical protein